MDGKQLWGMIEGHIKAGLSDEESFQQIQSELQKKEGGLRS